MSSETKQHILKRAVSQCPSITMEFLSLKVPSLLDSGSMVMLICEAYFNKHISPLLCGTVEELAEAHSLFWLSAADNQDMPVLKYFEADVTILGFCVPSVGFLVIKDLNTVLEPQYSTQSPGVIGCNLIWLGCEEFRKVFGFEAFETFTCPKEVHPLIFAQMCTLYHQGKFKLNLFLIHHPIAHNPILFQVLQFMFQLLKLISKFQKKTLVRVQKQFLAKYGLVIHTKLSAFQPIQ